MQNLSDKIVKLYIYYQKLNQFQKINLFLTFSKVQYEDQLESEYDL